MSKQKDVGRSWRTKAKHDLMRRIIGQEIGATQSMGRIRRNVLIDLNAGDAARQADDEWHWTSSPGLLAYYASTAKHPVIVALHEIDARTHERLLANLSEQLPAFGYRRVSDVAWAIGDNVTLVALNKNGMQVQVDYIGREDAVLVLHDPNAITDWSMRHSLAAEIQDRGVWCARSMSTLGSNACGIKRGISLDDRAEWFHVVENEEWRLPSHRDLLLAAIDGDSHQWAYLICTARKWRQKTVDEVRKSFKKIDRTVTLAWRRTEPDQFRELKRRLFLTAAERDEQDNQTLPFGDV